MADITTILSRIDSGDPSAAEESLPLVYEELRNSAAARMLRESPGQALQATALVHEAYVRLVEGLNSQQWGILAVNGETAAKRISPRFPAVGATRFELATSTSRTEVGNSRNPAFHDVFCNCVFHGFHQTSPIRARFVH